MYQTSVARKLKNKCTPTPLESNRAREYKADAKRRAFVIIIMSVFGGGLGLFTSPETEALQEPLSQADSGLLLPNFLREEKETYEGATSSPTRTRVAV